MTPATVTVHPDDSVEHAAKRMEEMQVRRLIVVNEDSRCVGIVAQADLARRTPEDLTGKVVEEISEPSSKASEASGC